MIALLDGVVLIACPWFSSVFMPILSGLQSFYWEISWSLMEALLSFSFCFWDPLFVFTFAILIMIYLGVGLFEFILFGTLCTSWTCMSFYFTKLGKFSVTISSNKFLIFCSPSPFGSPTMWILLSLIMSQRYFKLPSFFKFCFLLSVSIRCFLLPCLWNHWFDPQLHLICCWFHPVYFSFPLLSSSFLSGSFIWCLCPFYAYCLFVEVLTKFPDHPNKHGFELCVW